MIYINKNLVLNIEQNIKQLVDNVQETVTLKIGAIYQNGKLLWLAVYDAIKSCYGSGIWRSDLNWIDNDTWKSN